MLNEFKASIAASNISIRGRRFSGEIENSLRGSKRYTLSEIRRDPIDINVKCMDGAKASVVVTDAGVRYQLVVTYKHMKGLSGRTAVLNPSDYLIPGGRYTEGSAGYEEEICACTTLYEVLALSDDYYDWNAEHLNKGIYTNVCLYTPDVVICDNNNKQTGLIDVITCSPPDYNVTPINKANAAVRDRLELILNVAVRNNVRNLILCGFGCNSERSDVKYIADAMHDMCALYASQLDYVTIVVDTRSEYKMFKEIFN